MQYPGKFPVCIGLSAALNTVEESTTRKQAEFDDLFGRGYGAVGLEGMARVETEGYRKNNPLPLVQNIAKEDLKKIRFFMDCGSSDRFHKGYHIFHQRLLNDGIDHFYRIRPGIHEWQFWREGIVDGLVFATKVFHD